MPGAVPVGAIAGAGGIVAATNHLRSSGVTFTLPDWHPTTLPEIVLAVGGGLLASVIGLTIVVLLFMCLWDFWSTLLGDLRRLFR